MKLDNRYTQVDTILFTNISSSNKYYEGIGSKYMYIPLNLTQLMYTHGKSCTLCTASRNNFLSQATLPIFSRA